MEMTAYCGVDCAVCPDHTGGKCPGCRHADWREGDICLPVECCRGKGISFCGECPSFPCADMTAFYEESESHTRAYDLMLTVHEGRDSREAALRQTLCLKKANTEDTEKEWLFVSDMPEDENGLTNPWHGITLEGFRSHALPDMIRFSEGVGLPDWMVPETFLFLWEGDAIVGQFRIRHHLNEALREGAGHIGYFVGRAYRGRGLATEGLRLTLETAKDIVTEEEFYLRVNKDNPASLRVMLSNGGRIVREDGEKYYVRIDNPERKRETHTGAADVQPQTEDKKCSGK